MEVWVRYELKHIRCGKQACRCMHDGEPHGPYWYAFWEDPRTKKTKSRYMGKKYKPPSAGHGPHAEARSREQEPPPPPPPRPRRKKAKARTEGHGQRQAPPPGGQARTEGHSQRQAPPPRGLGVVGGPQDQADARMLGVATDVTQGALKRAWRDRIAAVHPDRYRGGDATERAQSINAAYDRMRRRRDWGK